MKGCVQNTTNDYSTFYKAQESCRKHKAGLIPVFSRFLLDESFESRSYQLPNMGNYEKLFYP